VIFFYQFFILLFLKMNNNNNFKEASEILHSKNNIDTTDKLKENLSHLENAYI